MIYVSYNGSSLFNRYNALVRLYVILFFRQERKAHNAFIGADVEQPHSLRVAANDPEFCHP